jgi:hypothetical protein
MSETFGQEAVLRDILGRNEETIRAFDIKSEIAMLCFVLSVEAGHSFISFADLRTTRPLLALVLFVTFIAALVAYMSVLFPAQNPKLRLSESEGAQRDVARNAYFIPDPRGTTTDDIVRAVTRPDHAHHIAYEILKLSAIRNAKRRRFVSALCITLTFYALLLVVFCSS